MESAPLRCELQSPGTTQARSAVPALLTLRACRRAETDDAAAKQRRRRRPPARPCLAARSAPLCSPALLARARGASFTATVVLLAAAAMHRLSPRMWRSGWWRRVPILNGTRPRHIVTKAQDQAGRAHPYPCKSRSCSVSCAAGEVSLSGAAPVAVPSAVSRQRLDIGADGYIIATGCPCTRCRTPSRAGWPRSPGASEATWRATV